MGSVVIGTPIGREQIYHLDVNRNPYQVYRFARKNYRDLKKVPNLYSTYCRLCYLKKKSCEGGKLDRSNHKQSSVEFSLPGSCNTKEKTETLRCRCDENSLQLLRQMHNETPRNYSRTLPSRFMNDRFMNEVLSNFLMNETAQMPLSTLVIRWRIGKNIPTYDKNDIVSLLACYGNVHSVFKQTPNSATVVFKDISSACRVIQAKHLGEPRNKIHCVWYHKFMSNKAFYSTSRGIRVRRDPFVDMYNNSIPPARRSRC